MKKITEFWFGDEASHIKTIEKLNKAEDTITMKDNQATDQGSPPSFEVVDGTAIIPITGSLVTTGNWMTRFLGLTSYDDIRSLLVEAAGDSTVDNILLNIDSPGGSAKGLEDVSTLIKKIDSDVKPVVSHTKGNILSAAYWIASATSKIYSTRMAEIGSIGVIATHFEITKQLEQDGVKATVFRAGEFKALGSPYETLSDKAKKIIQTQLDKLYSAFIEQVAMGRKTSTEVVRTKMAEGKVFFGYEALDLGMIDGLASIDDLVHSLSTNNSTSSTVLEDKRLTKNMESVEMKKILSEQAVATLASGGSITDETGLAGDYLPTADTVSGETVSEEMSSGEEEAKPDKEKVEPSLEVVDYLKEELSEAKEKVVELSVENKAMKKDMEAIEANHSQFRKIVEDATNVKNIALNRGSISLEKLSDEVLVQQYQNVTKDFNQTFPVGGQCKAPETEVENIYSNIAQAKLRAVRTK